ncbi:MAG: NADH-quinone oxidoreductase subunit A [Candidatus Micrarchaeaceae archaeon]
MINSYLSVAVIAVCSFAIIFALLLFSKLVRYRDESNPVKNSIYESAEESIGEAVSMPFEYSHYFPIFLGFEIIVIITLIWASLARSMAFASGVAIIALLVVAMAFAMLAMAIAHAKEGDESNERRY